MRSLLLGGARSGKSALAARWAGERSARVCAVVTALGTDAEMAERIAVHQRDRPSHWRVHEEAVRLGQAVREESAAGYLVLVDCLTLWISNCLWPAATIPATDEEQWRHERAAFLDVLRECDEVIVVSNEVGLGIVPENAVARMFRDEQGWLNQAVAQICDEVFLVTAGLPLRLKA
jgi:adenosylcobinamide kinase / adenosylcobinamide-phosphate guanylyltransferase